MGHYTTIARLAQMSARSQRQRRPAHAGGRMQAQPAGEGAACADEAPYRCPECGEGWVADTECPRCDVRVYRRDAVIELARREDAPARTRGGVRGRALAAFGLLGAIGLLVLGAVAVVLRTAPATNPLGVPREGQPWALAYGVFFALAIGAALTVLLRAGVDLDGGLTRLVSGRRSARARRRRMLRARATDLTALPDRTEAPVRVRGRVRIEVQRGERQLVITNGTARCRVRVSDELDAFDGEGPLCVLEDGATVELVGVGERVLGAGQGYRDARGEFEFRAAEAFVER